MQNNMGILVLMIIHTKKPIEAICRTPSVQTILFEILCGVVDLKTQLEPKELWSNQQRQF